MSNRAGRRKKRRGKFENSLILTFLYEFLAPKWIGGNPLRDELSKGKRFAYDIIWSLIIFITGSIVLKDIVRHGISKNEVAFLIIALLLILFAIWMGAQAFRNRHQKPKR